MKPMERLARFVIRRRRRVILAWVVVTLFGAFASGALKDRWDESFSIPGYSAYEANQRALTKLGSGEQAPLVAVFHSNGDIRREKGIEPALAAARSAVAKDSAVFTKVNHRLPDAGTRSSSFFATGNPAYVSRDHHTTFAEIYPPGNQTFDPSQVVKDVRAALKSSVPPGVTASLTGRDPLALASGESSGTGVGTELAIGGLGALLILMFVFGTAPAVAMPLAIAASSILTTFGLIWALSYVAKVSIIVQFLVALIGLGVAIDYSLLMIFRFREELARGSDTETALVATMTRAGRSVIVSGSTVAIGLLSMLILPLPFIRSIGVGGMLIPAVSVVAAITLLPAMLAAAGPKINRYRVMPRRLVNPDSHEPRIWSKWAGVVMRHPIVTGAIGLAIVVALLIPASKLNPSDAQAKDFPGAGDAIAGRTQLDQSGIGAGPIKPFVVLVEGSSAPDAARRVAAVVARTPGIASASAPPDWRRGDTALVEAIPTVDGSAKAARPVIDNLQDDILPQLQTSIGSGVRLTLGGPAPEERDFVHAVYDNFPYVLAFVVILTFLLLARAFRSLVLPLKAVILNVVSLGAAYGIVVFIFQQGHGSQAIWDVHATNAIIPWIPLMIFAFLFGLSMDYEVFMLTRMREAYDEYGSTPEAISHGLARTAKLVTSAALILMFAFFAMSTGPGLDIKQFGIGLAAGIIFDATVIRALLVPALMRLIGRWNWWLPPSAARALRVAPSQPLPETAA
ncbi:MAG: putative drug exporter of the superfamily [Solirubrobacterales bacterium]|nr:putative drug exporter of the superfamily [Solirubrobacterales bacterium]